nr:MAG TPA: hypothetical protein [Caudoviricetes sp.]
MMLTVNLRRQTKFCLMSLLARFLLHVTDCSLNSFPPTK